MLPGRLGIESSGREGGRKHKEEAHKHISKCVKEGPKL